jgi:uncharacterized protein YgbK (DUF1537 family)
MCSRIDSKNAGKIPDESRKYTEHARDQRRINTGYIPEKNRTALASRHRAKT